MMKLAVVGSRGFRDYAKLSEAITQFSPSLIISGGARGADQLGETWARRNGVETLIHLPDHKSFKHAYHHRNRLIAEACEHLLAFWDGRSTGTKYTIGYAKRIGRPVTVIRF